MEFVLDELKTAEFYIATKSSPSDERARVLKYGKMFGVFDRFGDIKTVGLGEQGVFLDGTRFLSEFVLYVGKTQPMLLSSSVREDNILFTADLTNVDLSRGGQLVIPRGSVHFTRTKALWQDTCYEQIRVSNYGLSAVQLPVDFTFAADFVDVFEVRGTHRARRGEMLAPEIGRDFVTLAYRGLDDVVRYARIFCDPAPARISEKGCRFDIDLQPRDQTVLQISVSCVYEPVRRPAATFAKALSAGTREMQTASGESACYVHSSNEQFNDWVRRSVADVKMMTVGNPETDYPYAGVPWFSTVFGRDGIITALECMWMSPQLGRGVLRHLADTQASEVIPESDAEPGKILHEERGGEMAALGEIPFGRYYGAVDSTPLFVMLAGEYYQRTGDLEFVQSIWPNIERALKWVDTYGDPDGDGFVEYARHSSKGLLQQGWKDSSDSVFHADGSLAEPPIALCEVQGYVYAAKRGAATIALAMGDRATHDDLEAQARKLRSNFEEAFWCPDLEVYALALDGKKRPCRVRSSNAGHCLYTGIADPEHAGQVARRLLQPDFFSGWGVRTIASSEARYNPVSYHNGSIWPHDNAIIAAGISRSGYKNLSARILSALLGVSVFVDFHRLPELICGLHRRPGEGPTLYPVACAPQAWSAAAIFMLLESCLGISVDAPLRKVTVKQPHLPPMMPRLTIRQLGIGYDTIDLHLERRGDSVQVEVLENMGQCDVVIV